MTDVAKKGPKCDVDYHLCEGQFPLCIPAILRCNSVNNCGMTGMSDEGPECTPEPPVRMYACLFIMLTQNYIN